MTRIIMCGCFGHMGKVIADIVSKSNNSVIVAGVDIANNEADFPVYKNIGDIKDEADVIIDFSHPSLLSPILEFSKEQNIPAVLCTTGYTPDQVAEIEQASKTSALFYSRNMSLGINLLIELSKKASAVLGSDFDIEIIEKHHNQKIDAPSGTALMIADAIKNTREDLDTYMYDRHAQRKKRDANEIGIHAVRGGTIVGEHEVIFAGRHEVLSLSHSAQSKELFANGAINASIFMVGKPYGLYDMSDML